MTVLNKIDHTLLKAAATSQEIEVLCEEALKYDFASVCVNPVWVKRAASLLAKPTSKGRTVAVCTVVSFPIGATPSETKVFETSIAIANGADEIDMVMNIGAAKEGDWNIVEADIHTVVEAAKTEGKKIEKKILVKVILETCYLTKDEIIKACECAKNAGADFVKTSTGFGTPPIDKNNLITSGATVENIVLMKKTVGDSMGIKAAGEIRSLDDAEKMIKAGASRLGSSAGLKIAKQLTK